MAASMGMGREMIKWDKPIETVDGRKARKIQTVQNELWNIVFVPGENSGDVFLINAEGCICGDRTNLRISKPFIRNARVKREGWVRVINVGGLPFMPGDVVFSEKASAEAACQKLGGIPAFITWEE